MDNVERRRNKAYRDHLKEMKEKDNANEQMSKVRRLKSETKASVLLVHHIGKRHQDSGAYKTRGASARPASADLVLNFEGMSDDIVKLEIAKNRWQGDKAKLFLKKVGEDMFEVTEPQGEDTASNKHRVQELMVQLLQTGHAQRKDLFDMLKRDGGFTQSTLERALSGLVQLGRVKKFSRGTYGLPKV